MALLADTTPEVRARLDALIRRMTPAQKVARAFGLREVASNFALAKIRADFPDESERRHRLRLALRSLPADLGRVLARRHGLLTS